MGERVKNIAVLITSLDADTQAQLLMGVYGYAKEHNCNVATFVWYAGILERDKYNIGEYNIANLPDLNLYDGVIVTANTMHMSFIVKQLSKKIRELSCPVVCIGGRIEGCYFVGADNYRAMKRMVEHLIDVHRFTKLHFVTGIKNNADAEERYRAYCDVLDERGIPYDEDRVTRGDFYIAGGEAAAKQIIESSQGLPEAVICSNDIMAITLCDALGRAGYKVPDDVFVTGYDYSIESQHYSPSLTTVCCPQDELGMTACKMILDIVKGEEVPKEILVKNEIKLGESCGCGKVNTDFINEYRKQTGKREIEKRKLIRQMNEVNKVLVECETYTECINALKRYIEQINPSEFYCCINDFVYNADTWEEGWEMDEYPTTFSETVHVAMAYKDGKFIKRKAFLSEKALPNLFEKEAQPKLYVFSPIHYSDHCFGYLVFVNSTFPIGNNGYVGWMISIGNAMENVRKQNLLRNAMKKLDDMYIKDALTGVYNRFGMLRFFDKMKAECLIQKHKLMVGFCDVDNLKSINDRFGHKEGDEIINLAAMVLKKGKLNGLAVVRYGGDEFVIMGTVNDEEEMKAYWATVEDEMIMVNLNRRMGSELSISYGSQLFDVTLTMEIAECIGIVDNMMYDRKTAKKKALEQSK